MKGVVRRIWRFLPQNLRQEFWEAFNRARIEGRKVLLPSRPRNQQGPVDGPLVVAGLFRSGSGLGEAARSTYHSLKAVGLAPIAVDLTSTFTVEDVVPDFPLGVMPSDRTGTLILHLNAPETVVALSKLKCLYKPNWRVIGYWAWELPVVPDDWNLGYHVVNEIWTLSEYTADAFRAKELPAGFSGLKVHALKLPVEPPSGRVPLGSIDRRQGNGRPFTVLTFADVHSSLDRKNPFGSIEAFKMAFGTDLDAKLIVKTRNLPPDGLARSLLDSCISNDRNIEILNVSLDESDRWALLAAADVITSLHRAEGFGLVLAEAMAIGKPTVATGWSGNMSFMNDSVSYLVPFDMVPIVDRFGQYRHDGAMWAEPSLDVAARHLRNIQSDAAGACKIGHSAAEYMATRHSRKIVGRKMKNLLENPMA